MYLVRDVFQTKPGKAKDLVTIFKKAGKFMPKEGVGKTRIVTDMVSNYWTVVLKIEIENLSVWEKMSGFTAKPEIKEII
jgi:hypothetical protein